ncbi:DUF1002 domain-containing protein [Roseburia sp. AM23-20]|uniref:DUF1002 domain-containing protein n=1 Tax=Roseburia sp. AM23-20 TaxID=2292066 RepID=UPI000E4B68FC|nr:DUF1002 domain-containing protein [Roseburia sp. AM23-20]RHF92145.1 DUF1002 domain-containing protein [Roseburia sp. AM23-20]
MRNKKAVKMLCMILAATMPVSSGVAVQASQTEVLVAAEQSDTESPAETSEENTDSSNIEGTIQYVDDDTDSGAKQDGNSTSDQAPQQDGNSTPDQASQTDNSQNISGTIVQNGDSDNVTIKASDKPYLALGADLNDSQRATILSIMGIDAANLSDYDVVYVTNAEEHQYLDSYISSSQIGTRSLSSVVIVQRDKGSGLNISTTNINYCTVGMYKNALTTAGVTDADIIVAGPTPISGTAALVGVLKAYQEMTGKEISDSVVDTALNELVLTGQLEESLKGVSDAEVEEFIAYIKALIAKDDLTDDEGINGAIDEACEKYGVTLSDDERQQIVDLVKKINSLGIDLNGLVDYAESLYNSFKNGDSSSSGGIAAVVGGFFKSVFSSVGDFFKKLFS